MGIAPEDVVDDFAFDYVIKVYTPSKSQRNHITKIL